MVLAACYIGKIGLGMNYYVYEKDDYEFAHVIATNKNITHPYLTKFTDEEEAWDYAEGLSAAAITDDVPLEIDSIINAKK